MNLLHLLAKKNYYMIPLIYYKTLFNPAECFRRKIIKNPQVRKHRYPRLCFAKKNGSTFFISNLLTGLGPTGPQRPMGPKNIFWGPELSRYQMGF